MMEQCVKQYLSFTLAGDTFAVDVRDTREILQRTTVTRVPFLPAFLEGVINVRGQVVPVVDMRRFLGLPSRVADIRGDIVIMDAEGASGCVVFGALVDEVQEVLELDRRTVQPIPAIGSTADTRIVAGIGRLDDSSLIVLNVQRIFTDDELAALDIETRDNTVHRSDTVGMVST